MMTVVIEVTPALIQALTNAAEGKPLVQGERLELALIGLQCRFAEHHERVFRRNACDCAKVIGRIGRGRV